MKQTRTIRGEVQYRAYLANIEPWVKQQFAQQKHVVFSVRSETRSLAANAAMWAALTDIAEQVTWHGLKLSKEDWKDVLTASLKRARSVPNIEGNGFVILGLRTSEMTIQEMSDLLELAHAFGAEQGVKFSAPERMAA
jgi:hypothetical protein